MTGSDDDVAPHTHAEQDPGSRSRAANQVRAESIAPGAADGDTPSTASDQPDAGAAAAAPAGTDRPQAGVPANTVTDTTPAAGTSEGMDPVQGVHTPDVGPGGEQIETT